MLEPALALKEICRPFVKWAGGKRQLLPELVRRVPRRIERYVEPFLGGGALFFALQPRRALLADVNRRLIRSYMGVRNDVSKVISLLKRYPHDEAFFYRMRELDIDAGSDAEVAAWFIYLNKTGFNGLYRVNRSNRFNVPFGSYENPRICDEANLRACSRALAGAELLVADFATIAGAAARGDFVYFDPPYAPLSTTSSFTSYTSTGFGPDAHERLRDVARTLKRKRIRFLLSNSAAPLIRELYQDFEVTEVMATRMVNSKASRRGAIAELLIW